MLYPSTGYRALAEYQSGYDFTIDRPGWYQSLDWFTGQVAFQDVPKNHALVPTGFGEERSRTTGTNTDVALSVMAPTEADSGGNHWFNLKPVEHPWYFGVYGGYAYNTLYQGGAENSRPGKTWESGHGLTIGLPVRFQIFNWLAVQVEPTFISKNYGYSLLLQGTDYYNQTINSFVDLPVLVNLSVPLAGINGLRLLVNGGFFLGVWVASHQEGRTHPLNQTNADPSGLFYEYDEDYQFDDRQDNRFDGGITAGVGIQYERGGFSVFTEGRYHYSLSDLQKPYQTQDVSPLMNDTWTLQIGVLINVGKSGVQQ
jgi:hypothetical protein